MASAKANTNNYATGIGYLALILWSSMALITSKLHGIPLFELLFCAFFISFFLTSIKLTIKRQWYLIKQPFIIWIIGVIGIYGNDLTLVAAIKNAPPIQADLINYLWPILVIIFAGLLPKERLTIKHLTAGLFGLIGIFILLTNGHGITGFQMQYLKGYLLALLDAIIWAAYTLLSRHYNKTPIEMVGMYCGLGALISAFVHYRFEKFVPFTYQQFFLIILMGLFTSGATYFLWDHGVKKGNVKLLSILAYGNPIISCALLIAFDSARFSLSIILACLFVIIGAIIGNNRLAHKNTINLDHSKPTKDNESQK